MLDTTALVVVGVMSVVVFILGMMCGMLCLGALVKSWAIKQGELLRSAEEKHVDIMNQQLNYFKQNILHEFQNAQRVHEEEHMSGYYHGSDDDDEEEDEEEGDTEDEDEEFDPSLN